MPSETFFNLPREKRQRILSLAIEEFADHGYEGASVSRLVARAGIAKGSFYQYFEDKRELFDYLLRLAADVKANFLQQGLHADADGTVFDTLRRMLRQGLEFEASQPGLARIAYRAYYGEGPLPQDVVQQARAAGEQFLRQLVEQGQEEGSIDPHLDADTVTWLFGVVFEHLSDYLIERLEIQPKELQRQGAQAFDKPEFEIHVNRIVGLLERATAVDGDENVD